ncbi:hypothetical protein [Actinobacillus porcinus]|uniref:hypothetical protein n=1 Tax=Actinobacillus porcinus TaxID=51048 RepID=UPI002A90F1BF|nr:hypothetical protein [Actinobacillus porcinus]MDY6216690.1 hypothetical protein [Actinobacillus porcinus]
MTTAIDFSQADYLEAQREKTRQWLQERDKLASFFLRKVKAYRDQGQSQADARKNTIADYEKWRKAQEQAEKTADTLNQLNQLNPLLTGKKT